MAKKKVTKKKSAARSAGPKPKAVKTGGGASLQDVARDLIAFFNAHDDASVQKRLWSPAIESIEGHGVSMLWKGKAACKAKSDDWMSKHRIHSAHAEGPYLGATGFAVKFRMDVETIETGERMEMEEIGVYTVKNGKIVREEFMYGMG